jgi:hypothetical protein
MSKHEILRAAIRYMQVLEYLLGMADLPSMIVASSADVNGKNAIGHEAKTSLDRNGDRIIEAPFVCM